MDPEAFAGQGTDPLRQQAPAASFQQVLHDYLQENSASLLGTLRGYVLRMGLAAGPATQEVVWEIFQESIAEALTASGRYDRQMPLRAWLLGIAANVIRRRKVMLARRFQREELLGDLSRRYPDRPNENAVLDTLLPPVTTGPAQIVEAEEQAAALLALVSPEDQRILRLAVLEGHQHLSLARELGITPNAARVRLHRALSRLRTAWKAQQEEEQKGPRHA
ncbi:MAG TPA: sigma-70 family RNA polymerase sigma factor [Ktedonobacteraceae bacterium]|nr:sigma-70 family RNA polymerase sigma factor [Ktedonobacteraceae bacterium]